MEIRDFLSENFTGKTVSHWKTVNCWKFHYIEKQEYGKYGQNSYMEKMREYKKIVENEKMRVSRGDGNGENGGNGKYGKWGIWSNLGNAG